MPSDTEYCKLCNHPLVSHRTNRDKDSKLIVITCGAYTPPEDKGLDYVKCNCDFGYTLVEKKQGRA